MILALMAVAAWFVMARFPTTPVGRALQRWLVDRPLARFAQVSRGQVMLLSLFVVAIAGLFWLVGEESTRLIAMAAPEVVSWATTFEIATVVDAVFAAMTAAGLLRFGRVAGHVRAVLSRRPRARRTRPARRDPDEERRAPLPRRHRLRRDMPLRQVARRRSAAWSGATARRR
jgi:hypothetical protein